MSVTTTEKMQHTLDIGSVFFGSRKKCFWGPCKEWGVCWCLCGWGVCALVVTIKACLVWVGERERPWHKLICPCSLEQGRIRSIMCFSSCSSCAPGQVCSASCFVLQLGEQRSGRMFLICLFARGVYNSLRKNYGKWKQMKWEREKCLLFAISMLIMTH